MKKMIFFIALWAQTVFGAAAKLCVDNLSSHNVTIEYKYPAPNQSNNETSYTVKKVVVKPKHKWSIEHDVTYLQPVLVQVNTDKGEKKEFPKDLIISGG